MSERSRANYALIRLATDILLTLLALFLSSILRPLSPVGSLLALEHTWLAPLMYVLVTLIWTLAFLLLSVYAPRNQRAIDEVQTVLVAASVSTLILAGMLYLTYREMSRLQFLMFYVLDLVFLIGSRLLVIAARSTRGLPRYPTRRVLVLGTGETGLDTMRMVESYRWAARGDRRVFDPGPDRRGSQLYQVPRYRGSHRRPATTGL